MSAERLLHPTGSTIAAMMVKDGEISLPIGDGSIEKFSLTELGAGFGGLTTLAENRSHAGLFNHQLLAERLYQYVRNNLDSEKLATTVDPSIGPNVHLVSHLGRFAWDTVHSKDTQTKYSQITTHTAEEMGVHILVQRTTVSEKTLHMVTALGDATNVVPLSDEFLHSFDFRLAQWADHVTNQEYEPLARRMANFVVNNHIPLEKREEVRKEIIEYFESFVVPGFKRGFLKAETISQELAQQYNAIPSERGRPIEHVIKLIEVDAQIEKILEDEGILQKLNIASFEELSSQNIPTPLWEVYLRRLYVQDAEQNIYERLEEIINGRDIHSIPDTDDLYKEFPKTSWWGKYVLDLWKSKSLYKASTTISSQGMERAKIFFSSLDKTRELRNNASNLTST